jgi:hypothetical protein
MCGGDETNMFQRVYKIPKIEVSDILVGYGLCMSSAIKQGAQ